MAIFTHLFGRRRRADQQGSFIDAQRRVLDYARYLENNPPMPGTIRDLGVLPHDKQVLKGALLMCISNSDDHRLEEHLKAGYLMLSAFQRDVGPGEMGTDFSTLDLEAPPLDIATRIECDAERSGSVQARVESELVQLRDDLAALELQLAEPARLSA